jgi:large subunit ribosomal protein L6
MSRIGKNAVALPKGVTATVDGKTVSVKGPKGELKVTLVAEVEASIGENGITVTPHKEMDRAGRHHDHGREAHHADGDRDQ